MKKFAILWIVLALLSKLHGQGKASAGYVITLQGDTLRGMVNYSHSNANPQQIRFIQDGETADQIYTAARIRGFGSSEEIYESCVVDLNIGPADYAELNTDKEIHLVKDTVFLKVLIKGPKSLFLFTSDKGKHNYYISSGSLTELLIYQKYLRNLDKPSGGISMIQNKKYVGQLSLFFSDMPNLRPRIQKTAYETNDLLNLFDLYYQKLKSHPVYEKKRVIFLDQAGVIGSFTRTKLFFFVDQDALSQADFPASYIPSVGVFYDKSLGVFGHYSINNELVYNRIKTSTTLSDNFDSFANSTASFSFQLEYLKLNSTLRRKISLPSGNLFLELGMSNGWLMAIKDASEHRFYGHWGLNIYRGKAVEKVKFFEQSWLVGVGIQYHRMGLQYRFEKGNGFSSWTSGLTITSQRQYLTFTYSFLK